MNTLELTCILKSDPMMKRFSPRVLAMDEFLAYPLNEKGLIICNSQSSIKLGEHWFLIFFRNKRELYFIDSLARTPQHYGVHEKFRDRTVTSLGTALQHKHSTVCGEFTVYFAYNLSRNIPLCRSLELFSHDQGRNALIVRRFLQKVFPGHERIYPEDILL